MADRSKVVTLTGPLPSEATLLKRARIDDRLNTLSEAHIEFVSEDGLLDLGEMVGQQHCLTIPLEDGTSRSHYGICTEAQFLFVEKGAAHYSCVLHPELWILTRSRNCRIFQQKTAMEIVTDMLSDHGLDSYQDKTSTKLRKREFTVQYQESDFDFISRLLEEEGVCYYFNHDDDREKLIFIDGDAPYPNVPAATTIPFREPDDQTSLDVEHFYSVRGRNAITSGKVTLRDYNFKTPGNTLEVKNLIPKGGHKYKNQELFHYPGKYLTAAEGKHYARARIEAAAQHAEIWRLEGNVRNVSVGRKFTLDEHSRDEWNKEFHVVGASLLIEEERGYDSSSEPQFAVKTEVEVVDAQEPYRPAAVTPRPNIPGVHLALVVGKSGEEIWTDPYGRVKLKFHWDRVGAKDENATCWVRVATPFAGRKWGMIHIPRVGQEVVVQFEEGDPDRPVVTGMMWNADNMPPYDLPQNATMQGIKTNKSKDGGGFNELVFEDKAGAEFVRLQSERDYKEIIKNNAEITIGTEHKNKGNLTQTIWNDFTETIKEGNHTSTIEKGDETITIKAGSQTLNIKKDQTETIEGKRTQTITGDVAREVKTGSVTDTISLGNFTLKASAGKVTVEAMQAIELKVGQNTVKIDMTGVTIKGLMVKVEGQAMTQVKAPMVQADASAMLILKGAMTMVN
jgi:type VI secretion system secreted protein VgrG